MEEDGESKTKYEIRYTASTEKQEKQAESVSWSSKTATERPPTNGSLDQGRTTKPANNQTEIQLISSVSKARGFYSQGRGFSRGPGPTLGANVVYLPA